MAFWNNRARADDVPATLPADPAVRAAYVQGRRDEAAPDQDDIKDAYDRGRRDERVRHHSSPLLTLLLVIVAAVGAAVLVLAVKEGSFTRGGAVVDNKLSEAAQQTAPVIDNAAAKTGEALQNAGESIKDTGQNLADRSNSAAK